MRRRARRAKRARRRCLPAATTSCTSLLCHGNLSLLSSHPQLWPMAMSLSSYLSYSSGPVLPSLGMLLLISAASSTSKTASMPLHSRLQTTLSEMLPDPTLSTYSWVLELHGPWLPSTGSLCDHLLLGSSLRNPHPSGQKTPIHWRRAWRTQVLQDNFIFHLRLLLVLLRHDLCSGDVRRHRAWLLKLTQQH